MLSGGGSTPDCVSRHAAEGWGTRHSLSSAAAAGVLAGEEEIEPNSKKPGSLIRGDLAPGDIIIITCHIPSQRKLSAHGRKVSDS